MNGFELLGRERASADGTAHRRAGDGVPRPFGQATATDRIPLVMFPTSHVGRMRARLQTHYTVCFDQGFVPPCFDHVDAPFFPPCFDHVDAPSNPNPEL